MDILYAIHDTLTSTEVNLGNTVFRLVLAMILGVLVGAERKRKGQIAGVRTFALISMGACMAMILSIYVPQEYLGLKNGDPGRIAAQVITGVGFLGGGAMIHLKGAVRGLTTASGIWMTASIGMAVGVGMYWCSIIATALILIILMVFETYEQHVNIGQENRSVRLTLHDIITDLDPYMKVFEEHSVKINTYFLKYDFEASTTEITFVVLAPSHRNYLPMFEQLSHVGSTISLVLTSQS